MPVNTGIQVLLHSYLLTTTLCLSNFRPGSLDRTSSSSFANLQAAHSAVDISAWETTLAAADSAAAALQAASTSGAGLNPFAAATDGLDAVVAAAAAAHDTALPALVHNLTAFNSAWLNGGRESFHGILEAAEHINSSLVLLPGTLDTQLGALRAGTGALDNLYSNSSGINLSEMPGNVTALAAQLQLPGLTNARLPLTQASTELAAAGPGLALLRAAFAALSSSLAAMAPAVSAIEAGILAFDVPAPGASSASSLRSTLSSAAPLVSAGHAAAASINLGAFAAPGGGLAEMARALDAADAAGLSSQASAVVAARQQVAALDLSVVTAALAPAETAYNGMGGDPAQVRTVSLVVVRQASSIPWVHPNTCCVLSVVCNNSSQS
jgi:hypothetical protein